MATRTAAAAPSAVVLNTTGVWEDPSIEAETVWVPVAAPRVWRTDACPAASVTLVLAERVPAAVPTAQ